MLTDLTLHVMLAIGRGPAHGYAIGKDISLRTDGRLDPSTGALYQALRRLTREGLVARAPAPAGERDVRRKYFVLTPAGRDAVQAEVRRLEAVVALARERRLYPAAAT
ncbi:MAG TPA: PadR family transcriptional regulator [Longimicrobiales bacterium]|nr:PadR family transcriptional regulator [Longimicrobiales bacterium]